MVGGTFGGGLANEGSVRSDGGNTGEDRDMDAFPMPDPEPPPPPPDPKDD